MQGENVSISMDAHQRSSNETGSGLDFYCSIIRNNIRESDSPGHLFWYPRKSDYRKKMSELWGGGKDIDNNSEIWV